MSDLVCGTQYPVMIWRLLCGITAFVLWFGCGFVVGPLITVGVMAPARYIPLLGRSSAIMIHPDTIMITSDWNLLCTHPCGSFIIMISPVIMCDMRLISHLGQRSVSFGLWDVFCPWVEKMSWVGNNRVAFGLLSWTLWFWGWDRITQGYTP